MSVIKKHFPKEHIFYKIFNKNTMKVSYSCMNNVDSIISSHNKKLLNPITNEPGCNCRIKENCPLNNRCLITNIVYEAKSK